MKAYRTLITHHAGMCYGTAQVWHMSDGKPGYRTIGQTRMFRVPASKEWRARSGAATICKRHCRFVHGNARDIQISEQ